MNDRRRDIAVMRALGAGRQIVLSVILLESILLAVGGGVLGFVLGHGLIGILGPVVETFTGVKLGFAQFVPYELILIPGLIVLAALAGYLPATMLTAPTWQRRCQPARKFALVRTVDRELAPVGSGRGYKSHPTAKIFVEGVSP